MKRVLDYFAVVTAVLLLILVKQLTTYCNEIKFQLIVILYCLLLFIHIYISNNIHFNNTC